ncbi:hypothetical protein KIH39_15595 [Telmatocola sphagniphila]|uniref:Uncharacterized protein n=1 Tax=Telmatocola sphagniphila TaxID=1123043 RepID=A0A8E6B4L1_9BACT|nr:hypothetical protein [Telmatocola sphagniphila]QVL30275.1 hypothetical protein KIH39_15595 [Telmatocola sphagniphila]
MKIECISKSAITLPVDLIRPELGLGRDRIFSLITGKQYVVYGITCYLGHLWYYICDEDYSYYPIWNPAPLFRITDNRISKYWEIGEYLIGSSEIIPIISFSEWVQNPIFYDLLTDREQSAVQTFIKYKKLIDEESNIIDQDDAQL